MTTPAAAAERRVITPEGFAAACTHHLLSMWCYEISPKSDCLKIRAGAKSEFKIIIGPCLLGSRLLLLGSSILLANIATSVEGPDEVADVTKSPTA